MFRYVFIFCFEVLIPLSGLMAQVGIGTNSPDNSAILDLTSSSSGFLPPRLTYLQIQAIPSPVEGLTAYCTDCSPKGIYFLNSFGYWVNTAEGRVSGELEPDDVVSSTGRIWKEKNLGAQQVATSSTDANSYGGMFQWGRLADGHEDISSPNYLGPVSTSASNTSDPWYGDFITVVNGVHENWLDPADYTLWVGLNSVNNPCPTGYRLPTRQEWSEEISTWDSQDEAGAFSSALKLPFPGIRSFIDGSIYSAATMYWTSSFENPHSPQSVKVLHLTATSSLLLDVGNIAYGLPVRCIRD